MRWSGLLRIAVLSAMVLLVVATGSLARAAGDDLHAFLDRDHAQLGDTVTLNVEVRGDIRINSPDISAFGTDFKVLGTSRSSSLSIENGRRSEKTLWAVALKPLHEGTLTVPSVEVAGRHTRPLTLHVDAAPPTGRGEAGDAAFLAVTFSTLTPYVGQQVAMTVKLFFAPNLTEGSLEPPQVDGADLRALGRDDTYQTERHGRRYHVVERHYALVPRQAGHIDVPGIGFQGRALDPTGFAGMFSDRTSVTARSQANALDVRTRPAAAEKGPWLPARNVKLRLDGLPPGGRVEVGQPITLTLREEATGLAFEALPEPSLPAIAGAEVYPDKSQGQTGSDDQWLTGTRERKFAVVPTRTGTLRIPDIELGWWNVQTDAPEVARLAVHALTVVPGTSAVSAASTDPGAGADHDDTSVAAGAGSMSPSRPGIGWQRVPWRAIALAALSLWVLSALVVLAWRRRRRHPSPTTVAMRASGHERLAPSARKARHAFLAAVRAGDVTRQASALLAWARAERPAIRHLGDLTAALDDPRQRACIAALQRSRYGRDTGSAVTTDDTVAAFARGLAWRPAATAPGHGLPPLYPPPTNRFQDT